MITNFLLLIKKCEWWKLIWACEFANHLVLEIVCVFYSSHPVQIVFSIPYTVDSCHIALSYGGVMSYVKVCGPLPNTGLFNVHS